MVRAGKAAADANDNGVVLYHASVKVDAVEEQTLEMSVITTANELVFWILKVTFPFPLLFAGVAHTDVCANTLVPVIPIRTTAHTSQRSKVRVGFFVIVVWNLRFSFLFRKLLFFILRLLFKVVIYIYCS